MLELPTLPALNHLLRHAPWALGKLKVHAGKSARFVVGPATFNYAIQPSGEVRAAANAAPDATFRLTPASLARALFERDRKALQEAEVSGDTALASDIAYVAQYLDWDVEEDLSRFIGDIAAHRVVGAARGLEAWQRQALFNLAQAFKEYWTEEQPVVAGSDRVAEFVREVDRLRDDVERLEKRIDKLTM
jgi:ubiquinone biosynthesis accessory factor UbiJ